MAFVDWPWKAVFALHGGVLTVPSSNQALVVVHIGVEDCPNTLAITSHKIKKKTLTLKIYAPAAGKIKIAGKGLHSKTKTATGRETLTIKVNQKKAGKLKTKVRVTYTRSTGKTRKKQTKTVKLRFKK